MSKYIDVEWLKQNFNTTFWSQITKTIDSAPSIDIVRCRECIHCADDWNGNQPQFTCELGRCGESVQPNDFCSYGNSSEKPNNCEHITEDGVTCAKYPACDDCLDNPLNKVKGSERLVKGSERSSE